MMKTIDLTFVTTAFELPGHRVLKERRGRTWRHRALAKLQRIARRLIADPARRQHLALQCALRKGAGDAFALMLEHAAARGANAIIGVRYDATEVAAGVTEVLAYGTAVLIE